MTHQVTQDALNRMYMGGEFKLTKRYAQQMALFFSLLLFSAALPGLYVFGLLAFVIYFTVDKFLFTRFYRTPEKFDASLAVKFGLSTMAAAGIGNLISDVQPQILIDIPPATVG